MYPEQGPVWDWLKQNRQQVLERLGTSYQKNESGTLRQIPDESLNHLHRIFDETGATERFVQLEKLSEKKAKEMGMNRDTYFNYLYTGNTDK